MERGRKGSRNSLSLDLKNSGSLPLEQLTESDILSSALVNVPSTREFQLQGENPEEEDFISSQRFYLILTATNEGGDLSQVLDTAFLLQSCSLLKDCHGSLRPWVPIPMLKEGIHKYDLC